MSILINPLIAWAVHPADQGNIKYIDGLQNQSHTLPYEGDVITRPFLVDPQTKIPVLVRVVEIQEILEKRGHTLAVVVTRADRNY
jgi:hypothetical protein